uniref:N-acetylphosphatidylethanolamine-hydrolyzing phospholipase D n=2 Tax=Steinernema glaseri TaxID=37863 RepID=A0A1I7YSN7_9BILA
MGRYNFLRFILILVISVDCQKDQMKVEFAKPTFDGTRYGNPKSFTGWTGLPSLSSIWKWKFTEEDNSQLPSAEVIEKTLPVVKPNFDAGNSSLAATWLGHATVLVQLDSINFITDPVWSHRASPLSIAGPKRYRPPPVEIKDLPQINFGVISHNHYDHLDANAVADISRRFPDMDWFVPMGLKSWMESTVYSKKERIHEMNWGESASLVINGKPITVYCIPAQHWSQRGVFDKFKTLWSGWAVVGPNRRFYYTGDTGYCEEEFAKLGMNLGPFDLSAIPIGCYAPRWFMKPQHINGEEAVQIHLKTDSKHSMAIHWGTYAMGSNEAYDEPPKKLQEAVVAAGLTEKEFFSLKHGETWKIDEENESKE